MYPHNADEGGGRMVVLAKQKQITLAARLALCLFTAVASIIGATQFRCMRSSVLQTCVRMYVYVKKS